MWYPEEKYEGGGWESNCSSRCDPIGKHCALLPFRCQRCKLVEPLHIIQGGGVIPQSSRRVHDSVLTDDSTMTAKWNMAIHLIGRSWSVEHASRRCNQNVLKSTLPLAPYAVCIVADKTGIQATRREQLKCKKEERRTSESKPDPSAKCEPVTTAAMRNTPSVQPASLSSFTASYKAAI